MDADEAADDDAFVFVSDDDATAAPADADVEALILIATSIDRAPARMLTFSSAYDSTLSTRKTVGKMNCRCWEEWNGMERNGLIEWGRQSAECRMQRVTYSTLVQPS